MVILPWKATPFAERGRVWSHCNYRVVAEEHNHQTQQLGNKCWDPLNTWHNCRHNCTPWQRTRSMKSADLIGHIKFLPWGQLNGCSVTRPFLCAKGVACETTVWDGNVNAWLRVSYNTLASLCVGGKGAIHLLNRIAIIQTWWRCRKVGRAWYVTSQDHHEELLSTMKWFISSCQGMMSQMDKIFSKLVKQIHPYSSIVTTSTS